MTKIPLFFLGSALVFSGCLATSQEITDLRGDIVRLQSSLSAQQKVQGKFQDALRDNQESLQGNQADLSAKMEELTGKLESLSSQLVETDNNMMGLATRIDDLDKNTSNRLDAVVKTVQGVKSIPAPSPSRFYQAGANEFAKRRYGQAIEIFQTYLDQYPDTERAPQAQYFIGESHFAQKNWEEALEAFNAVLTAYPKSRQVPTALLQKGLTLEQMGKTPEAIKIFDGLRRSYPHRKEAQTAHGRLKVLRGDTDELAPKPKPKPAVKPKASPPPAPPQKSSAP
ncbi:MAG: tol-pal system protein YbgF [Elusimicrobia bacterium]|jgi:tol-pal system protein YbgF|nr:tol-pal system protein YbgF [Elusimicrobiota bacterium]